MDKKTIVRKWIKKTIVRKWVKEQQYGNEKKNNSSEMGKRPIIVREWAKEQQFGNG